jgi:hypothetical protein
LGFAGELGKIKRIRLQTKNAKNRKKKIMQN